MHRGGAEDAEGSDIPLAKAQRRQVRKRKTPCHFDRREKSFLDPSRSLGMTGFGPSPWRLCAFARDMVFPTSSSFPNFKHFWLGFTHQVAGQNRLQHAAADGP